MRQWAVSSASAALQTARVLLMLPEPRLVRDRRQIRPAAATPVCCRKSSWLVETRSVSRHGTRPAHAAPWQNIRTAAGRWQRPRPGGRRQQSKQATRPVSGSSRCRLCTYSLLPRAYRAQHTPWAMLQTRNVLSEQCCGQNRAGNTGVEAGKQHKNGKRHAVPDACPAPACPQLAKRTDPRTSLDVAHSHSKPAHRSRNRNSSPCSLCARRSNDIGQSVAYLSILHPYSQIIFAVVLAGHCAQCSGNQVRSGVRRGRCLSGSPQCTRGKNRRHRRDLHI